ncbi:MAG: hypothetical protein HQL75_07585 [Magnetococcales bacterium]|nr:hypothetical protein [Magnetococcales bacterium]
MQVQRFIEVTNRQVMIELPESFINHRVALIVRTADEAPISLPKQRRPHPEIAGKGRTLGDLVTPIVDEGDWDCLQ